MGVAVVQVTSPLGARTVHELVDDLIVVGRRSPSFVPDVVLEPDPDRWVGRSHCRLEQDDGRWWAVDHGSVNGTQLRRGGRTSRLEDRTALQHGDALLILGDTGDTGDTDDTGDTGTAGVLGGRPRRSPRDAVGHGGDRGAVPAGPGPGDRRARGSAPTPSRPPARC